jgi:Ras-related protein Rab-11A
MSEEEKEPEVKKCKVVFIGDAGVGKTCIINRFVKGIYNIKEMSTNGATFTNKTLKFKDKNINLQLDIWDTAGQEKFKAMGKFFYKGAAIAVLVYDITRMESFNNLKDFWMKQLKNNSEKNISKILFYFNIKYSYRNMW